MSVCVLWMFLTSELGYWRCKYRESSTVKATVIQRELMSFMLSVINIPEEIQSSLKTRILEKFDLFCRFRRAFTVSGPFLCFLLR